MISIAHDGRAAQGQAVPLVSISADDAKDDLIKFLDNVPMPWTHWFSGPDGLAARWGIQAYPTVYVVDAKEVIRFVNVREGKLDAAVDELLKEAEAK